MLKLKRIWFLSIHYSMERIPLGLSGRTQWIINGNSDPGLDDLAKDSVVQTRWERSSIAQII